LKRIAQLERDLASTNAELADGTEKLEIANKKSSEVYLIDCCCCIFKKNF